MPPMPTWVRLQPLVLAFSLAWAQDEKPVAKVQKVEKGNEKPSAAGKPSASDMKPAEKEKKPEKCHKKVAKGKKRRQTVLKTSAVSAVKIARGPCCTQSSSQCDFSLHAVKLAVWLSRPTWRRRWRTSRGASRSPRRSRANSNEKSST